MKRLVQLSRWSTLSTLAAVAAVVSVGSLGIACGSKPAPVLAPMLPGEGTEHTAKPAPIPTATAAVDPWAGRTDLIAPPAAPAPQPVALPAIASFKLKNGLQVFAIQSDRLPVMSFQLAVRAGRRQEPRSRLGVSELTADMLVRGTKQHDGAAIAKAIESVGGTIAADSTFEATLVSCSVLARDARTCLSLLPELLQTPTFPEAELEGARAMAIGSVRQRLADPGALAGAHLQNLLWGEQNVRGWITTDAAFAALRREDLVAWHKAWFAPSNTLLVVSGAFDGKQLKADLERSFGAWKSTPVPPTPQYQEPGLSGSRIRLVDRPGQTQTFVRVAQFGIAHDDPQFFDATVWNYALGGSPESRLARAVKLDATGAPRVGPSFGASSSFDRNSDRGTFSAQTIVRNGEAVAAAKQLLAEIAKMAKQGPTQAEVTTAIANLAGTYGLRFQSAADLGAALVTAELHGFGTEYLANYPTVIGRVDAASAAQSAAAVLTPSAYVLVLVGDAKDLEPQLKKAGWRYQKVSASEGLDGPRDADVVAGTGTPPVVSDPKVTAAARALVDAAITAKGGRAKLEALKAFRMQATGTTTIGPQSVPVDIERLFVVPDKLRIDATLGGRVKVTVAVSGPKGWQLAPDQTGQTMQLTEVGGPDMASVDFERWREPELILLRAAAPTAQLSTGPDETIAGRPQSVVKLRAPYGNVDVSIYLDKVTKLITKMAYREGTQDETDEFADYRDVDGIKVAYSRHSTGGGRETKLELKAVDLAAKWDAQAFDKPSAPAPAP